MRAWRLLSIVCISIAVASCGPAVDLRHGLQVLDVSTGWFDAGIVGGKSKLVPSVTLKLKNISDRKLTTLQLNALFRRVAENDEWGSAFLTAAGSEGLAAGITTSELSLKSQLGYTGTDQTRAEMLQNSHFVDAKVELFAKYGSTQWTRVGEYPVERRLITR